MDLCSTIVKNKMFLAVYVINIDEQDLFVDTWNSKFNGVFQNIETNYVAIK